MDLSVKKASALVNSCVSLAVHPCGITMLIGTVKCLFVWYWLTTIEVFLRVRVWNGFILVQL